MTYFILALPWKHTDYRCVELRKSTVLSTVTSVLSLIQS
uniref:Uncharacterized protein n=1 Tax=Podoviridae sp. ctG4L18 TaxID=2825234 RepID=A0A8S5UPQ8_9CAUD|nr:MAG TPA: hypothetical protein [Podoviridae sp. ctG4L18]